MSNRLYDILKWVAILFIPALATLTATIGNIWEIEVLDNVSATISAVGFFIGACIKISTTQYNKGVPTKAQANEFETTEPESPNEGV